MPAVRHCFGDPLTAADSDRDRSLSERQKQVATTGAGTSSPASTAPQAMQPRQPAQAATPFVTARTYWADLKFDKAGAQQHGDELLQGNCADRHVKVVVDSTFLVTWEYR